MRKNIVKFSTVMAIIFASGDALCMKDSRMFGATGLDVAKIQEKTRQIKANATDLEDLVAPMSAGIARTNESTENKEQGNRTPATKTFDDRLYERIQAQTQGNRNAGLPNMDKGIGANGTRNGPNSTADRPQLVPTIASYQGGIGQGPRGTLNNRQSKFTPNENQRTSENKNNGQLKDPNSAVERLRRGETTKRYWELEQGIRTNPDGTASKGNSLVPGGTLRDTGKTYYEATVKRNDENPPRK